MAHISNQSSKCILKLLVCLLFSLDVCTPNLQQHIKNPLSFAVHATILVVKPLCRLRVNVNAVSSVSKILNTSWLLKRSRQTVQIQIKLLLKFCYSDMHFVNSSPDNQLPIFLFRIKRESVE